MMTLSLTCPQMLNEVPDCGTIISYQEFSESNVSWPIFIIQNGTGGGWVLPLKKKKATEPGGQDSVKQTKNFGTIWFYF